MIIWVNLGFTLARRHGPHHSKGIEVSPQNEINLASKSTSGFFYDTPNPLYNLQIQIHCEENSKELQHGMNLSKSWYNETETNRRSYWPDFWQANYEPTWSCMFERRLGLRSDGGKWVCDPHRLKNKDCMMYSFGSREQFDFENAVHKLNTNCEIHTFDPFVAGKYAPSYLTFHPVGLEGKRSNLKDKTFLSLPDIVDSLDHENKTIDILKVDIEGSEFNVFTDNMFSELQARGVKIRQILIEIHRSSKPEDHPARVRAVRLLFDTLERHKYVIFHKEPNIIVGNGGQVIEYAFLLVEGISCEN